MSTEQNKSIVRRWVEGGWNKGNLALIDELYVPGYTLHDPNSPMPVTSAEAFKAYVTAYRTSFPDMHFTLDSLVAEGDTVAWHFTSRGTHLGPLGSLPPSGKAVVVTGTIVSRFENGKWAEDLANVDILGLLQQIGVIPVIA